MGKGILRIERLQGCKLDYYMVSLTSLSGECDWHGDINTSHCELYSSLEYPIGYFYADRDEIYMMPYEEEYLQIFKDIEKFPPDTQYIEAWHSAKREQGDHYGYFSCRLVCSEEGFEDTFQMLPDAADSESDGKIYSADYHNYIIGDGDTRYYSLYPDEIKGTQEYQYITWKEGRGITDYASWSGNYKDYIFILAVAGGLHHD